MTWKMCLVTGLFFFSSNLANSPFTDTGSPHVQKTDANPALASQDTGRTKVADNTTATEYEPSLDIPFAERNPDVVVDQYPLYAADLDRLMTTGSLSLPHPEGGILNIVLRSNTEGLGSRTIHVLSNGYPGTITQRPDGFFATLATPQGTYTLENRGTHTYLVRQRQLDQRINPTVADYRHVPAA